MPATATIIVAYDSRRGIARKNEIPWPRLDQDLKMFRETTTKNIVIMGRKTWDSLPVRPLPDRINIIITKNTEEYSQLNLIQQYGAGVLCFDDLEQAILKSHSSFPDNKIYIAGGQDIYEEAIKKNLVSEIIVTEVEGNYQCDRYFPELKSKYAEISRVELEQPLITGQKSREGVQTLKYQIVIYRLYSNMEEQQYINLMNLILNKGVERSDRTGVGTKSLWGQQLRFNLERFPLLTTKKMFLRGVFEELKWFISGDTNIDRLKKTDVKIWDHNSSREFLDQKGLDYPEGTLGPCYGYQWRNFNKPWYSPTNESSQPDVESDSQNNQQNKPQNNSQKGIDQLQNAIDLIKKDPDSRRIVVSAWNPCQLDQMALPPCHMMYQFAVYDKKLNCRVDMRSADLFLGVPFNIASYALLTTFVAQICDLSVGELVIQMGDTHIYKNHMSACREQINRSPYRFPTLNIKQSIESLNDILKLRYEDLELNEYYSLPAIKAPLN